jgi:hypothetical protein
MSRGHGGGWGRMNRSSPPRALNVFLKLAGLESPVDKGIVNRAR